MIKYKQFYFLHEKVRKKFTEYDDKIRHCVKEIDEFRDLVENLTIFLNIDVIGKINGILKFLNVSCDLINGICIKGRLKIEKHLELF